MKLGIVGKAIAVAAIVAAGRMVAQDATASPRYVIEDLGTLGGTSSMAYFAGNAGAVAGTAWLASGTAHAAIWNKGQVVDAGTPGLGGTNGSATLNSIAYSFNRFGQLAGGAEKANTDPNGENFCGYGTGQVCVPFVWQSGTMRPLPTLGGSNGQAISINNLGLATGVAETGTQDAGCAAAIPSQALDYEAVIWNTSQGGHSVLAPVAGDTVSIGLWINDLGVTVGQSGSCGNTLLPPLVVGPHAVLWDKSGAPHDLGSLGGECATLCISPIFGPFGNTPLFVSNSGQVVGVSAVSDEGPAHAFLWTPQAGKMKDLGTLAGDYASVATSINDNGVVVGISFDNSGNPRAFLWKNGKMVDLNSLLPGDAPIYALIAQFINSSNEIAGFGVDTSTGDVHAFLAVPCGPNSTNPACSTSMTASETMPLGLKRRLHR
jgi:probable HAF family extracellular repeat protein